LGDFLFLLFPFQVERLEEGKGYTDDTLAAASRDYEAFLASGKLADIIIRVDGKELQAHRQLLAARSPVLAAMFGNHEYRETKENVIEVTDMRSDVFEELLRFIYSGKAKALERMAPELLAAADKVSLFFIRFAQI